MQRAGKINSVIRKVVNMLKVRNDEITIHRRDAFSLLCDIENIDANKLFFYVVDEENKILLKKGAKEYENGVFFVFDSNDTNIPHGWHTYFVQYTIDEQNVITTNQNTFRVIQSV